MAAADRRPLSGILEHYFIKNSLRTVRSDNPVTSKNSTEISRKNGRIKMGEKQSRNGRNMAEKRTLPPGPKRLTSPPRIETGRRRILGT